MLLLMIAWKSLRKTPKIQTDGWNQLKSPLPPAPQIKYYVLTVNNISVFRRMKEGLVPVIPAI